MKVNPETGFYRITVSLAASQPSDLKLIGTSGAEVQEIIFVVKVCRFPFSALTLLVGRQEVTF